MSSCSAEIGPTKTATSLGESSTAPLRLKRVRGGPLDTPLDTAGLVAFCPSSAAFSQLIENPSPLGCRFLTKYSFCIFSKTREPVQFLENPPTLSSISIRHGA